MIPDVNPSEGKPPEAEPPDAEPTDPLDHFLQRRRRQLQIATAVVLVLLPVLIHVVYRSVTSLPSRVTLATGPEGGRYEQFMLQLGRELEQRGVTVTQRRTAGSLEHLELLRSGQVDLALYQANPVQESTGSDRQENAGSNRVAFVANVYSEVAHLLVRSDAGISTPADLAGRRVSLAPEESGDHGMARMLLDHFGIATADVKAEFIDYLELEDRFEARTLDAAFIVVGLDAPVLQSLVGSGRCRLLSIPHRDALLRRQPLIAGGTVPSGYFGVSPSPRPEQQVETVSVHAQLLTGQEISGVLVKAVTEIVLDPGFQKTHRLGELLAGQAEFARQQPEFTIHPAAMRIYDPKLRTLIDPALVDITEGLRSLIASLLIAGVVAWRWWKRRQEYNEAHRLEIHVEALEEIEQRQLELDSGRMTAEHDIPELQRMLDQVTKLRWRALEDFSVHEQMEDAAVRTFLNVCNALSSKINAKLSRARLDLRFDELVKRDRESS
ncbi:MAG TPA: hypothetical protein DCE47_21165 [Planctomycetaceae bacterium]|nr:hypothetical protein [Planctomycetaceae bacterium]|tara:strand:- start:1079 stop:2566 length:1488 start_codon:yes stop_codon:yes gene_type:complete